MPVNLPDTYPGDIRGPINSPLDDEDPNKPTYNPDEEIDQMKGEKGLSELMNMPINAVHVSTIDGQKLYSSDKLKDNFVKAMAKSKKLKSINSTVAKYVENGTINVCWMTNNPAKFIFTKIFLGGVGSILGFYNPDDHKMYLMIDSNTNIFGFASNKNLSELVLHESMHMAARSMKTSFIKLFENELTAYYAALFKEIFQIEKKQNIDKEAKEIYEWLFKMRMALKGMTLGPYINKYHELLGNKFKHLTQNPEQFEDTKNLYLALLSIYFKSPKAYVQIYYKYPQIIKPLYNSYNAIEKMPAKAVRFLAVQEMFTPSEVIAIYSEYTKSLSKIYQAFNKIK